MSNSLTNTAVLYATLALNSEIALQKDYLHSGDIPDDDDLANEEDILEDLEQAFMEFVDLYKERSKTDKGLPPLEELLNSEL
jgi:hypothetical protein